MKKGTRALCLVLVGLMVFGTVVSLIVALIGL